MIERGAHGVLGLGLLLVVLTGCGSGEQHDGHSPARLPTATAAVSSAETTSAAPITSGASAAVGEVPGNPGAAAALRPWVRDLTGQDLETLVRKCWTIEPGNARNMYGDKDAILAAVAQPGVDGQFAVLWKGPVSTVSVKRSEIASGYACPRVYATGSDGAFDDADARYAVRRYLSRWIGKPVNADDIEGKYPLVCPGSVLANNPGRLTGTTGFGEMTTAPAGISDVLVTVPVTNSSGVTQPMVFTVAVGPEGYCINDITG